MNFIMNNIKVYLIILLSAFVLIDYETIFLLINGNLTFNHVFHLIFSIIGLSLILFYVYFVVNTSYIKIFLTIGFMISLLLMLPPIIYLLMFDEVATYTTIIKLYDNGLESFKAILFEKLGIFEYILITILYIIPFFLIYFLENIEERSKLYSFKLSYLVIGLVIFIFSFSNLKEMGYVSLYNNYSQAKNDITTYNNYLKLNSYDYEFSNIKDNNSTKKNLYVLVIGGSSNRNKLGLYGYKRETTPFLRMHKDNLYIFDNVISTSLNTGQSVYDMLSFKNNPIIKTSDNYSDGDNNSNYKIYPSIIEMFKQAKYKTYWISNVQMYNPNNLAMTTIANKVDVSYYLNNTYWEKNITSKFDEELIKPLEEVIKDNATNKFVVIHLYGNEYPYIERYPSEFNKFKSNKLLLSILPNTTYKNYLKFNSYDNSIYYVDNVINSFINLLHRNKNISSYLIYTSAYGEDVLSSNNKEFYYHNKEYNSKYMYEIPFIVWFSNTYRYNNKEFMRRINNIDSLENRPYALDRFSHTISDISHINSKELDATKSIFSKEFKEEKRVVNSIIFDDIIEDNETEPIDNMVIGNTNK